MHIFNRVTHQTPESVELEFTLAGIGSRAWALVIDYNVLAAILIGFLLIIWVISSLLVGSWGSFFGTRNIELWLGAIAFITIFAIYTGYFVFFETLWQGQTPGKRLAKIRVIQDDGRLIGLQQATLRALIRSVDDTFFVGALLIMLTKKEKRLGDLLAGTIVIQTEVSTNSASFPVSSKAQEIAMQLQQSQANFSQLLPDEFATIRDYLQRRSQMTPKAKKEVSLQLAKQTKAIIGLDKLPTPVEPDVFLEAVYLAYQQQ
ncbi:RDD family protein [Synechocystis sp. PCC 7509]|uniref:RDD family protein n=1 Tax=Synechocystis sp. PCC 7509 TaxID=927677 RepID=UPI0002AC9D36|nr:RDD family protein [Synechocystis sp. PCC 7509]